MSILRKAVGFAVCFAMVFTIVMTGAQITTYADDNELSASKTAVKSAKNEYDITFSLPSKQGEVQKDADVVILMDKSSVSDLAGLKAAAASFIDKLVAKEADGVNFKVAVVWFNFNVYNGDATSTGLVDLSAGNAEAIKNSIKDGGGAGTNLHGGVLRAKSILDADTTVSDNNKFMIVATDLAGYAVDAGNGTGLIRYNGPGGYMGNGDFGVKYGALNLSGITSSDINDLIVNKKLVNGVTGDETWLKSVGSAYGEFPLDQSAANTVTWAQQGQPNIPTMFEKSIYLTGNLFLEMKNKGYNLVAINQPYQSGGNYTATNKAYQEWFGENAGKRYDLSSGVTIDYAFNDIASDVFDLLGKGTITDVIADNFEMKGPETMKVVLSGTELAKTKISENKYGFGTKKDGVYPYVATYDSATKTVKFDINKSVSRYELLQFVFTEKYVGENDGTGKKVPTNKSAKIDYMNSLDVANGVANYNKTYSFASPVIQLDTITPQATYNVNYKFISGTDGKTLPAEVTKLLPKKATNLADGTKVYPKAPTVKTVKTGDGTWTFTGWDKSSKTINSADVTFVGAWIFEKGGANPKTGDNAPLALMLAAIALCGAGVAGMAYKKRKQSK